MMGVPWIGWSVMMRSVSYMSNNVMLSHMSVSNMVAGPAPRSKYHCSRVSLVTSYRRQVSVLGMSSKGSLALSTMVREGAPRVF